MDIKIKCGGMVTSIRNPDGTELLARPVHNKWLNWGMVLLTNGGAVDNTGILTYDIGDRARLFGSLGLFYGSQLDLGSGSSASTIDMTALETNTVSNANFNILQNVCEIADGKLHFRFKITFGSAYTFREFGLRRGYYGWGSSPDPRINDLLFRVVLDGPVSVASGTVMDYDFFMTIPYATRTVVSNLFGTGIPGEIWARPAYDATKNNLMQTSVGYSLTTIGNVSNTASPWGLLSHGYIESATNVYTHPMFSADTAKDFPADGVGDSALPITTPGSTYEWVSHDETNYVATLRYVIPASMGNGSLAYGNIRGLAFRFGSYDSTGNWVGQAFTKDAAHKLNIQLTYTFESM